jgi:hypothetical protein
VPDEPAKPGRLAWLGKLDTKAAAILGTLLASALTALLSWVGSCHTNQRVDATNETQNAVLDIAADMGSRISELERGRDTTRRDIRLLKSRRAKVLIVDTLKVTVVQKPQNWWSRLWAPTTTKPRR